jgi:hypothetical protein
LCINDQRSWLSSVSVIPDHDSNPWSYLSSVSLLSSVDLIISSTRPRNLNGRLRTLRLEHIRLNRAAESGFVRRSASWSRLDKKLTVNFFLETRSLTKWKSILMCFVRAWNTGLKDRYVAPILSHQRVGLWDRCKPSFVDKNCNHWSSAAVSARALYSALVLLRAIVACCLLRQKIKFEPRTHSRHQQIDDHLCPLPNLHQRTPGIWRSCYKTIVNSRRWSVWDSAWFSLHISSGTISVDAWIC